MNLFELKERLNEAGAHITFCGSFSHSIIEELGTAVREYLASSAIQKSAMMDVFSVYVEAAQNVRNYTEARLAAGADVRDAQASILVIARSGEHYEVHAGNVVEPVDAAALTERIDALRTLDRAALKAAFKAQLHVERPSEGGTAGLGLIEMARRASAPLGYELTPLPDGRSYFSLRVVV